MLKRSQLAAMNIQYQYFPFTRFLDDAVKYGFFQVEVWAAAPHFHPEDLLYGEIARVRDEIVRRGLRVSCYTPEQCVYPINLAADRQEARRRSLRFFENHIRAAAELGADRLLVTSGWGYFDGSLGAEPWRWARDGLRELCLCAEAHGISLGLEVLRRDESDLVHDLPSLLRMLDDTNAGNLGAVLDTCPMSLNGETPADYAKALGAKLLHVHFIDGMPGGHLAWGDGALDAKDCLDQLEAAGYQGALSLEITDRRYFMEPGESLRRSTETLCPLLDGAEHNP